MTHFQKIWEGYNNGIYCNCIWFCVNRPRLEDKEKKYIESMIELYSKNKNLNKKKYTIPIIFIYTKAYNSEEKNIITMKSAFKNLKCFENNEDEFNFIDVIAKENKYHIPNLIALFYKLHCNPFSLFFI